MTNRNTEAGRPKVHWHPHRLEARARRCQLIRVERGTLAANTFLDNRFNLDATMPSRDVSLNARPGRKPVQADFLFHTAFCGSTLLSRCLDAPGQRLAIREPLILRQWADKVAGRSLSRAEAGRFRSSLAMLCDLPDGERALVKPSNLCNGLIPQVKAATEGKAIFLYGTLEDHLVSWLKKTAGTQAKYPWLLERISAWFDEDWPAGVDTSVLHGDLPGDPLRTVALVWQLSIWWLERMQEGWPNARSLAFQDMLADPEDTVGRVAKFLGAPDYSLAPFKSHAKDTAVTYSVEQRAHENSQLLALHQRRIEDSIKWLADCTGDRFGSQQLNGNQLKSRMYKSRDDARMCSFAIRPSTA